MSQAVESLLEAVQERRLPWFLSPPGPHHYDGPYMVLDFETTNAENGSPILRENSVVAVAWYVQGEGSIQYERGNEFNLPAFSAALQQHQARSGHLVGHNIKFDLQWLARCGHDLHHYLVYDTMLGEYVLDGNVSRPRNLDAVAKRYGRVGKASHVDNMMRAGVCPSEMPHDYLRARAIRDVKDTLHIYLAQKRKLTERRQLAVQYTRCLLTPVLAHMELQGLRLDKARVQQEYDRAVAEYNEALLEFNELTGGVNPRSPAQMAKLIYDKLGFSELTNKGGFPIRGKASKAFPLGAPKTDQKTLDKLRATTAQQKRFLELRAKVGKLDAQLTKTLTFFKKVVDERGGIFYGQYNQAVTATHRLSSSGRRITFADGTSGSLQFQNMPNAFKDLIRAKQDGWLVGDHDGSQLEFRVAAFLGNDAKAKTNIRADVDQHTFTAAQMLNKPESEVTKEERRLAKPDTFKPMYGGQRGTKAQERYYAAFRREFAALAETQKSWTYTVLESDKLRTPWGMEFHFPGTRMRDDGYIDNTPSIYNYPIQSLATAEIIPIALVYLWHRLYINHARSVIVNTVHDSVVGEVAPDEQELWLALGLLCFTVDVYEYLRFVYDLDFDVPLGVGSGLAERWEAPGGFERELNVEPDGTYWSKGDRAK